LLKSLTNPEPIKFCSQCSDYRPKSTFGKNKSNKDGLARLCKKCTNSNKQTWKKKNPDKVAANQLSYKKRNPGKRQKSNLDNKYKYRYGISLNEFKEMCVSQHNLCAICLSFTKLCVDHDHKNGRVRGLLCGPCNRAIGCLKDSSVAAERAVSYLRNNGN
jgi:hypothetical protein